MENPTYRLEGILKDSSGETDFEGPLSLILMLLSKNKIEIRDINIADILDQYLAYLDTMQAMDLEVASEFIQMASHLLYIKTKMLLNLDDGEVSELEQLIASLEQLQCKSVLSQIQSVVPALQAMSERGGKTFTRYPEPLPQLPRPVYSYHHDPEELMASLLLVFNRIQHHGEPDILRTIAPKRILRSVKQKSRTILEQLKQRGHLTLLEILRDCEDKSDMITAFLSVLELCSLGSILISGGDGGYTVQFAGGDLDEIVAAIASESDSYDLPEAP